MLRTNFLQNKITLYLCFSLDFLSFKIQLVTKTIFKLLKARTSQQNSIYQVLDELGRPAPVKVLWELASNIVPGLGLATVYRALKALSREGKIANRSGGPGSHYEKMRDEHTHYFVCEDCQQCSTSTDALADSPSFYRLVLL